MTEIPEQNVLSIPEISAEFSASYGLAIGQLTVEKLNLQKQVQALQASITHLGAENANLKAENSNLIKAHISLEGQVMGLQKELEARPTPEDVEALETTIEALEIKIGEIISAGPTLAQSAAIDVAKTKARKEKVQAD
jgi:predicted RNase H-like nuclease (RuvC/YqgF family)